MPVEIPFYDLGGQVMPDNFDDSSGCCDRDDAVNLFDFEMNVGGPVSNATTSPLRFSQYWVTALLTPPDGIDPHDLPFCWVSMTLDVLVGNVWIPRTELFESRVWSLPCPLYSGTDPDCEGGSQRFWELRAGDCCQSATVRVGYCGPDAWRLRFGIFTFEAVPVDMHSEVTITGRTYAPPP